MSRYKVVKITNNKAIKLLDCDFDGFIIKPKNNVRKKNTVKVTKARIADKNLIKHLINKKIDKKYSEIFKMVTDVATDDSDDESKMGILLNEIELFRSILKNKYAKYMELEEYHSIENRMYIMGKEIKHRLMEIEEEKIIKRSSGKRR